MTGEGADRFHLAGVIGWPAMHSRSPVLHGYWFEQHHLRGAYLPLEIPPQRFEAALRALPALNFAGCNLTMPHKIAALDLVDGMDEAARRVGAINTITVGANDRLFGSNTDGFGFYANLNSEAPSWRPDQGAVVVIGAGGAARSIVHALNENGVAEIRLVNRTRARAEKLAADIGGPVLVGDWDQRARLLEGATLVVNTTSQGMHGHDALDLDLAALPKSAVVADIVYFPRQTALLAAAAARGNPTVGGLGMLLHQARPCWKLWFGIDPEVTPGLRAAVEATF
jgi:shikimate dehydrogenase